MNITNTDTHTPIHQNVYEPPVPEAVVKINLLEPELSYDEVMDKVTAAMSSDTTRLEVGEKTAMRRRLLNAWQFVRQLKANRSYQNFWRHTLQGSIIFFTFISILTGVMSSEMAKMIKNSACTGETDTLDFEQSVNQVSCDPDPEIYGLSGRGVLTLSFILRWLNILMPLLNSFFISLNSLWVPGTKYTKLTHCGVNVESEIYKCRSRAGEYSAKGGNIASAASTKGAGDTERNEKGEKDQPKGGGPEKAINPRTILAERLDDIWNDIGSSEIRQGMLVKPSDYICLCVYIRSRMHVRAPSNTPTPTHNTFNTYTTITHPPTTTHIGRFARMRLYCGSDISLYSCLYVSISGDNAVFDFCFDGAGINGICKLDSRHDELSVSLRHHFGLSRSRRAAPSYKWSSGLYPQADGVVAWPVGH